ncbi:MAG: arsenate reductase ArsC [Candidatus Omnitrophica bacterium]|nr:arsenate reductase ArsC [Candidatus Omnitrophota bacterium]
MAKKKVLFLCTGNSCRSQMAEGWTRQLLGDEVEAFSAGVEMHGLNPYAVKVMREAGVDISGHRSKLVDSLKDEPFDLVVTVCENARQTCPMFPGESRVAHREFDDPPRLAEELDAGEEETINIYREVRDRIKEFVERRLPQLLAE